MRAVLLTGHWAPEKLVFREDVAAASSRKTSFSGPTSDGHKDSLIDSSLLGRGRR